MQIDIQSPKLDLTTAISMYLRRRVDFALSSWAERVRRVEVRLADVNGPRGGEDKLCRIRIILVAVPDVVVEDVQADLYAAIDRAAARASRAVNRKLAKLRNRGLPAAATRADWIDQSFGQAQLEGGSK